MNWWIPKRRAAVLAVVPVLAIAACSGPGQQVDVDVRGQLADLELAPARAAARAVPLPPYVEAPDTPAGPPHGWTVNPEIAKSPKPSPEGTKACPFTDPRQQVVAATDAPASPPAEARYEYFATGVYEAVSSDGGQHAVMPDATYRSVENVTWGPGRTYYEFDMVTEAVHGTTTSRFRVVLDDPNVSRPDVPRPVNVREPVQGLGPSTEPPIVGTVRVGTPAQPGMYLLSVQPEGADARSFNDGAGMLLVRWPALGGDQLHGQAMVDQPDGPDGSGGESSHIAYTSTVQDKGQVEACGTMLDSRAVRVEATITGDDGDQPATTVDATYNIATQYGGLVIADRRTTTVGSDATSSVRELTTAKLKGAPKPAADRPDAPACLETRPDGPVLAAGSSIEAPPVEATYRMDVPVVDQTVSSYQTSGISPDAGKLPSALVRTVRNVEWDPSGQRTYFEYETVDDLGGSVTTTKYRVVPEPENREGRPTAEPEPGDPGMYLVATTHPDGKRVVYNDGAGILVVPFPVDPDAVPEYTMAGSDGTNAVVAAGYVSPNDVVTACGQRIEGWRVDLVISPGKQPAPKPEPEEYVDTRLLPPSEPPRPSSSPPPPTPSLPPAPPDGPRSGLELMRTYTDLLHDSGHTKASYAFTIAPGLGGLVVASRSTVMSVNRVDEFQQSLVYTLTSKPEVPR